MKRFLLAGAVFMALGVMIGAFGAHALKSSLSPEMMTVYKTGVEYQFYHALALLAVGIIGARNHSKWLNYSGILFGVGIVLFSGSLYALSISEVKVLGAVTPIGGLAFIGGWVSLVVAISKR